MRKGPAGESGMRVLVVEDEPGMAQVIRWGLEGANYVVDVASDGAQGLKMALESPYAIIILDLMLPRMNGWQVCEELRSRRMHVPILMLTARGAVDDRIRGLDAGADDYLPKPFDFNELLARLRALLRRDKVHRARVIRVADLEIDTGSHRVTRAGKEIGLSSREYDLLEALAGREGQVLTREVILERIWNSDEAYSNTVDVRIGLLRKKIDAGHPVRLIHTVRGVGYTLRRPTEEDDE